MRRLKEVLINIKGTQNDGEQNDVIEFVTEGKMQEKDGKLLLSYDESAALGVPGTTTYLKVDDKKVVIQRTGHLNSRLLVEKQKRNVCHYATEHGDIMIGVFGEIIENNIMKNGSMYLKYTLDINCQMMSTNEIELSVEEVKN